MNLSEATLDYYLGLVKKFVFATYDTDKRLFKIRNRFILGSVILSLFQLVSPSSDPEVHSNLKLEQENVVLEQEESLDLSYKKIISYESVKTEKIKELSSDSKTVSAVEVENMEKERQNIKQEYSVMENPYIIILMTTSQEEYARELKNKWPNLENLSYKQNKRGKWISYIGPFDGYTNVKSHLKDLKASKSIPQDSYVAKD